jgi:hypothetical protein
MVGKKKMMDSLTNFSTERYIAILLFAIALPIIVILPLLNDGERTVGTCLYNNHRTWSLVQVELGNSFYEITVLDALYEPGEKVNIAYDPKNINDYVVLGFAGIYLNKWGVISGMIIFVSTALYFTARDDKYEKAQKNKWTFKNPWKGNPFIRNRRK